MPLPNLTQAQLLLDDGEGPPAGRRRVALNTCSSEVLVELLRHLKRTYWPYAWDSSVDRQRMSSGGFRAAAKAALGSGEMTAALRAVSATAAHRLQRGIWTSPGAGDINRWGLV